MRGLGWCCCFGAGSRGARRAVLRRRHAKPLRRLVERLQVRRRDGGVAFGRKPCGRQFARRHRRRRGVLAVLALRCRGYPRLDGLLIACGRGQRRPASRFARRHSSVGTLAYAQLSQRLIKTLRGFWPGAVRVLDTVGIGRCLTIGRCLRIGGARLARNLLARLGINRRIDRVVTRRAIGRVAATGCVILLPLLIGRGVVCVVLPRGFYRVTCRDTALRDLRLLHHPVH